MAFTVVANGALGFWIGMASPTGYIKVYNGSGWAKQPVKVWDGAAWVQKPVKVWNGTAWVETN